MGSAVACGLFLPDCLARVRLAGPSGEIDADCVRLRSADGARVASA